MKIYLTFFHRRSQNKLGTAERNKPVHSFRYRNSKLANIHQQGKAGDATLQISEVTKRTNNVISCLPEFTHSGGELPHLHPTSYFR